MPRTSKQHIGLGGTFDHFHAGHESFIQFAAGIHSHLKIGVTKPQMTRHKPAPDLIEPFSTRIKAVSRFCQKIGVKAELLPLEDLYGPTLESKDIFGLAVTENTISGAKKINELRLAMNLRPLEVFVCPLKMCSDGSLLSSSRIRTGQVSRQGEVHASFFDQDIKLTANGLHTLKNIQGKLVDTPVKPRANQLVILVGDETLKTFEDQKLSFDLAIIDGKTRRDQVIHNLLSEEPLKTSNPAGSITQQAVQTLQTAQAQKFRYVLVDGEEDLLVVSLVMITPLETLIYYGQPDQGLVELRVNEQIKQKFLGIVRPHNSR